MHITASSNLNTKETGLRWHHDTKELKCLLYIISAGTRNHNLKEILQCLDFGGVKFELAGQVSVSLRHRSLNSRMTKDQSFLGLASRRHVIQPHINLSKYYRFFYLRVIGATSSFLADYPLIQGWAPYYLTPIRQVAFTYAELSLFMYVYFRFHAICAFYINGKM